MGLTSFDQRAFFRPPPEKSNWDQDYGLTNSYHAQAEVIRYLTDPDPGIDLAPVYGISTYIMALVKPAEDRMFQVIAAALASQRQPNGVIDPTARPIVLLSCGTFGPPTPLDSEQHCSEP